MNRTYISKAIMLQLGEPIGDPFGFGQRQMPLAAIGAAFATVGTALAGGAVAGGAMAIAGASLTVVATVATVAGLAMTIVGAATGNQDLIKIGGIVGLAGGVAGLGAMGVNAAIGSAGLVGAQTAATAAPAASAGATSAATGGMAATQPAVTAAVTPALTNAAAPTALSSGLVAGQSAAGGVGAGVGSSTGAVAGGTGLIPQGATNAMMSAITPTMASTNVATPTMEAITAGTKVASQSSGFFEALTKPEMLIPIGTGMVKGMFAGDQADAKREAEQARLDFERQQYETKMANANSIGRLNLQARPLTQAERDAAALAKAERSNRIAQTLTKPAGT